LAKAGAIDSGLGRGEDLGRVRTQLADDGRDAHGEITAVPEIAGGDVALGGLAVGLLDEGGDAADAIEAGERLARPNVAEAGGRLARADAEDDDLAVCRRPAGERRGGAEAGEVADQVVGSEHEDGRLRIAARDEDGSGGDRGGGVARLRLQDEIGLDIGIAQGLGDQEAVVAVGDDHRRREERGVGDALQGAGEGRAAIDQRQEGLRRDVVGGGPQTRAGAAAHDHRDDTIGQRHCPPRDAAFLQAIRRQWKTSAGGDQAMSSRRMRPAVDFM
jgi:hypothetical protein